jgi:hypothetical protein
VKTDVVVAVDIGSIKERQGAPAVELAGAKRLSHGVPISRRDAAYAAMTFVCLNFRSPDLRVLGRRAIGQFGPGRGFSKANELSGRQDANWTKTIS